MLKKNRKWSYTMKTLFILFQLIFFVVIIATPLSITGQESILFKKKKLAILAIDFDSILSVDTQNDVRSAIYNNLVSEDSLIILNEREVKAKLALHAINPTKLDNVEGYILAGHALDVDYILTGSIEKIGNLLDVIFNVFTMPKGIKKEILITNTLDAFINNEIPKMTGEIRQTLNLTPTKITEQKSNKKAFFLLGGAALLGGVTYAILSGGSSSGTELLSDPVLPGPPGTDE